MKKEAVLVIALTLIIAFMLFLFFAGNKESKPLRTLPYFDPKDYSRVKKDVHHVIPAFSLINQYGKTTRQEITNGKVYVVDCFFTTCHSICPIMSNQLVRVYAKYKSRNDFLILSHTVDPETDTVAQMLNYAKEHGVTDEKWLFLTGNKKDLYALERKGYMLTLEEGDGGVDDFIHTQNFALIDKEKHIRGFYDGTDTLEVNRLITDIQLLFDEYAYKERGK